MHSCVKLQGVIGLHFISVTILFYIKSTWTWNTNFALLKKSQITANNLRVCKFYILTYFLTYFTFTYFEPDSHEISKLIKSKKCSINKVPTFIYKFVANEISPLLSTICSKTARKTPTYKTGNRKFGKNCLPISSLPFLNKVFEKLIHSRGLIFLCGTKLFSYRQIHYGCYFEIYWRSLWKFQ